MAQVTLNFTPLSHEQWKSVGKVFLWVAVSVGCAVGLDLIFKNHNLLASAPVINVVAVALSKVLQGEEQVANAHIPQELVTPIAEAEKAIEPKV